MPIPIGVGKYSDCICCLDLHVVWAGPVKKWLFVEFPSLVVVVGSVMSVCVAPDIVACLGLRETVES